MVVELIVTLFVAQVATPPQEPIRVVPGAEPDTKTMYRAVKQGEQRVEGLLRRIESPPGPPVSFMRRVKNKPMRVSAPTLTSVEYIAHRPDFRGPVTCGGKTPPDHVYLTYKSVDGAPRAVAVEFLPAR